MPKEIKDYCKVVSILMVDDETLLVDGENYINEKSIRVVSKNQVKNYDFIEIVLTGDKRAYLTIPKNITPDDIKLLLHQIDGIRLVRELEKMMNK